MIRRRFLGWAGKAAVVALVTTQGFRPAAAGEVARPELTPVQQEQTISPVLQALNKWNEDRWLNHGGVLHEDAPITWDAAAGEFRRIGISIEKMYEQVREARDAQPSTMTAEDVLAAAQARRGKPTGAGATRRNIVETFFGAFKDRG